MHSGGLELTKPTYIRLEDNLIRHRGDRVIVQVARYSAVKSHGTGRKTIFGCTRSSAGCRNSAGISDWHKPALFQTSHITAARGMVRIYQETDEYPPFRASPTFFRTDYLEKCGIMCVPTAM